VQKKSGAKVQALFEKKKKKKNTWCKAQGAVERKKLSQRSRGTREANEKYSAKVLGKHKVANREESLIQGKEGKC
jgi:hypothetical protein